MSEKNANISKNKMCIFEKFSSGTKLEKKCPIKFLSRKIIMFKVSKQEELSEYMKIKSAEKLNNNEGRWTKEEHEKFLEGLVQHGINWKKVKSLVDSRSSVQVRSHAQKFFKKLKTIKDESLGIDFTSDSIKNIKDMIQYMKAVNDKFNIKNVFIYLSDRCDLNNNKISKKKSNPNIIANNKITNSLIGNRNDDFNLNKYNIFADINTNNNPIKEIEDVKKNNNNNLTNNNFYNNMPLNNNILFNNINQTLNLINLLGNPILNNNNFYPGIQNNGNNFMINLNNNISFPNLPINNILNTILINNILCSSFPLIFQNYCQYNQSRFSNAFINYNSENDVNSNIIKNNSDNNNIMKDNSINKLINDDGQIKDNDNKKRNDIKIKDDAQKKDVNSNNNMNIIIKNNNANNKNLFNNNNFNNRNYNSNSIEQI